MKRLIYTLFMSLMISFSALGQEVSRSAVTSGGATFTDGSTTISSSYGQIAVQVYQDNDNVLTLGFQQPRGLCIGDLNQDGYVNTQDMLIFLSYFGCVADCIGDFNGNGTTDTLDLLLFLSYFGTPCVF